VLCRVASCVSFLAALAARGFSSESSCSTITAERRQSSWAGDAFVKCQSGLAQHPLHRATSSLL
jgi:hypothetical protein